MPRGSSELVERICCGQMRSDRLTFYVYVTRSNPTKQELKEYGTIVMMLKLNKTSEGIKGADISTGYIMAYKTRVWGTRSCGAEIERSSASALPSLSLPAAFLKFCNA